MIRRFGVTEVSKGDEEHGTSKHVERGSHPQEKGLPHTQVQESTPAM